VGRKKKTHFVEGAHTTTSDEDERESFSPICVDGDFHQRDFVQFIAVKSVALLLIPRSREILLAVKAI
jgi:hypothetical protein